MALGADRYASRADTLVFIACVLLSLAAMGLPDRMRDPFARTLRQTVLAPLLALQQQTERLSAALERYDAVVAQRDSAAQARVPGCWSCRASPTASSCPTAPPS